MTRLINQGSRCLCLCAEGLQFHPEFPAAFPIAHRNGKVDMTRRMHCDAHDNTISVAGHGPDTQVDLPLQTRWGDPRSRPIGICIPTQILRVLHYLPLFHLRLADSCEVVVGVLPVLDFYLNMT